MDQATNLLQRAPFDRRTVHMLCRVLEDGWTSIRPGFAGVAAENAGRKNLADGIFSFASAGQRNPEALKLYAVSRALTLLGPAIPKRTAA